MRKSDQSISSIEHELQRFPPAVVNEFRKVIPLVAKELAEDDFYAWAGEGVAIAQSGPRCWQAAAEYFRVTPQALGSLDFPQLINWARWGRRLAEASDGLSKTYFQESPAALDSIPIRQLEEWAKLGKSLYRGTWRSDSLASQFFQVSPGLFRCLSLDEIVQFTRFIDCLAKNGCEGADDCLNSGEGERARFLSLVERISHRAYQQAIPFLINGSLALSEIPSTRHHRLLTLTEEVLILSCPAATEFLKSCPAVLSRISSSTFEHWFREGMLTLQKSEEGGIAYFRTELNQSARFLERFSAGVELSRIKETLERYSLALTGRNTPILPTNNLKQPGISWVPSAKTTAEGVAILLPENVKKYPNKEENFTWYKVMVTHQAGHLEFGSFDFCFEKKANLFSDWRPQLTQPVTRQGALTDLKAFFDLFSDRKLAAEIFTVVEDSRVDYLVNREYKGISQDYQKVQNDALNARPPLTSRPLRELFLEVLIQISLGSPGKLLVPSVLRAQLHQASLILRRVQSPEAEVEDSAEATIRLYQILCQIPNSFIPFDDWEVIDLSGTSAELPTLLADEAAPGLADLSDEEANVLPYSSPQEVEFRGDFRPELVQLLTKLKERAGESPEEATSLLSWQTLKELSEQFTEIEINDLLPEELASSPGILASDLKEVGQQNISLKIVKQKNEGDDDTNPHALEKDDFLSFLYDEWDFRANDYRQKWCRVRQKTMNEGTPDFFEATLNEYAKLAAQIKGQFELLNPQSFRKIKRLQDGEDFDLDAVVDSIIRKKAGQSPNEKVYWRRNKTERDVSVAFLLDMSSSTIEYIDERQRGTDNMYFIDYKGYLDWLQAQHENQARPTAFKRIIDLEKESLVLLIKALETIGDSYAIYGFSGYGRKNVEFYVIKELEEEFSDKIKGRIDSISPIQGTRMGPAIRHATWKLEQQPAKSKFLFLISDGRPQDHGYGKDGLEKEYAINDTKMALLEARWKNITPFCLTVDRAGHDYLRTMCGDIGYEVVADIESLPKRLPALYRKLTI